MLNINGALKAIGYGLLVLFFAVGIVKTCSSLADLKRPEHALKLFVRFALAKAAVTYGLDLMLAVFRIVQGMVSTITVSYTHLAANFANPRAMETIADEMAAWRDKNGVKTLDEIRGGARNAE